jgi:integrase
MQFYNITSVEVCNMFKRFFAALLSLVLALSCLIAARADVAVSELNQLDKLKDADYLYACFLCFTALRRGEILGLRWKDIDFMDQKIYVCNNVIFPDGSNEPVERIPKAGSKGVVYLQSELLKRIRPYRLAGGYVISGSRSDCTRPISRSSFTKMWNRIKRTVDLKGATSHCFRATYATMMNAHCNHIDVKALQGALRHKTPDLAIRVYTKTNDNKTRKAEEEYDEWIKSQLTQTS